MHALPHRRLVARIARREQPRLDPAGLQRGRLRKEDRMPAQRRIVRDRVLPQPLQLQDAQPRRAAELRAARERRNEELVHRGNDRAHVPRRLAVPLEGTVELRFQQPALLDLLVVALRADPHERRRVRVRGREVEVRAERGAGIGRAARAVQREHDLAHVRPGHVALGHPLRLRVQVGRPRPFGEHFSDVNASGGGAQHIDGD